jgi:hypothetical protein
LFSLATGKPTKKTVPIKNTTEGLSDQHSVVVTGANRIFITGGFRKETHEINKVITT